MVKWIGALVLVGLSVYFAASLSRMEYRRVRQSEGFLLLLRYVRTQISCFRTPMEEIARDFRNDALEECGFLPVFRARGFSAALRESRDRLYLEEEEGKVLAAFGDAVGRSYLREQTDLCDCTLRELEKSFARRREEAPKRTRTVRSLVLCVGLMLVVVLL